MPASHPTPDRLSPRRLAASGTRFAVATPHVQATRAAVDTFQAGGNAIDAALAAATTLAVAYPQMCGVGGDLFALVRSPGGGVASVNSTGRTPAALDADLVRVRHRTMPDRGPLTITVPGAVAGWASVHGLGGRRRWSDAFTHAARLAAEGCTVAPGVAASYREHIDVLLADVGARDIHTRVGHPLRDGDTLVNAALARTLDAIADEGPSALYAGEVGELYVDGLSEAGCPITLEDLREHRAEILEPLVGAYRGLEVRTSPPTSQGFALLQALSVVERLGIDPDPLGPDADVLARTFVAAARERDAHLTDAALMSVPVEELLSEHRLETMAHAVRHGVEERRGGTAPLGGTAGLVASDADGFAVSLIQSLAWGFGSGVLEPRTGILTQNRGSGFVLGSGDGRDLAAGRRPPHTLMPVMAHRDGRLVAISGTMGGPAHPQINAMSLIRSLELGMPAAEAVSAPRWIAEGLDAVPGTATAEADVPDPVVDLLEGAGLAVTRLPRHDSSTGHAHLIVIGDDGSFDAGTDPRADGEAAAS
jgi:gamma-glutamyltranspeptidase/glutathione hydrolase